MDVRKDLIFPILDNLIIRKITDLSLGNAAKLYRKIVNFRNRYQKKSPFLIELEEKRPEIMTGTEVLNGPFKGLICLPGTLPAQVLGSYEREIHQTLTELLKQSYTSIVNIGCSNGYFAVGIARHCPDAAVYAFDQNERSLADCKKVAELNGIKLIAAPFCSYETLMELPLGEKAIIVCDVEGYEHELFDEAMTEALALHDVVIELHDGYDINTTKQFLDMFERTHECIIHESIDDIRKAYTYSYSELEGLSLAERRYILRECREYIQNWLIAKARS